MENPPRAPERAAASAAMAEPEHPRRRPVWGVPVVVIAVVLIVVLFVVGFTGLFANPVKSVSTNGTATLSGSFEPYVCNGTSCDGYISAGARSVFVVFPPGCAPPARAATITVTGKPAPELGDASYRATACAKRPTPGSAPADSLPLAPQATAHDRQMRTATRRRRFP